MSQHPGLMVIDWSNMCHRAFHGLGGLDDLLSTEVFNLANSMALNAAKSLLMSGGAVAHIMDGGFSGREQIFPGYKSNRSTREDRPQGLTGALSAVHTFKQAPISHIKVEGFEADDVMANLAWDYASRFPSSPTFILSNDKDLYQVVNERISILRHKGTGDGMLNMQLITPEIVEEQYGFSPLKIIDYKALQGDSADCIPGVPGIGHGIACRLIKRWGSANHAVEAALRDEREKGFTDKLKHSLIMHYPTIKLNQRIIRLRRVPNSEQLLDQLLESESPIP